jgi:histidine ammonia-lyase
MVSNTAAIVGVEAMAAAQGIDLKRSPQGPRSSAAVEGVLAEIRQQVAFLERDRYLADDVETMRKWAMNPGRIVPFADIVPSSQGECPVPGAAMAGAPNRA